MTPSSNQLHLWGGGDLFHCIQNGLFLLFFHVFAVLVLIVFAQELRWESQNMTSDVLEQKLKALCTEDCRSVTKYEEGWFCFKLFFLQVFSLWQPDHSDT